MDKSNVNEAGVFEIDLNKWTYKEFKTFRKAAQDDDDAAFMPLLLKVIVAWPFSAPVNLDSLENMGMADLATVLNAVNKAVENTFRAG